MSLYRLDMVLLQAVLHEFAMHFRLKFNTLGYSLYYFDLFNDNIFGDCFKPQSHGWS